MIKSIRLLFIAVLFMLPSSTFGQDVFGISGKGKSYSMSFKLINDLIVVPVKVNGSELNFLLDTGVNNTIMFNLSIEDSTRLKNTRIIRIRGLGEGGYINAIQSEGNLFELGRVINGQHMIYLIPGKEFDLAARMGVDISGIIGGDLFRDFIIDINYSAKRLKFYKPNSFDYQKCRKCESFDLSFNRGKPYIDIQVRDQEQTIDTKLLIDTGGGKTLWLFDRSSDQIKEPRQYFEDFLGKGLSGNIYGRRSKIDEIIIGNHRFKKANVAYPDSVSVASAYRFKERNGSLGAGLLKRFRLLFDYRAKKLTLRRKSSYYSEPFLYNMSGIELLHGGTMLVQDKKRTADTGYGTQSETKPIVQILYEFVYDFKPLYRISSIRKNSPAEKTGLLPDDVILEINGKGAYQYKLEEIIHMFSKEEGKWFKLLIDRNGKKMIYSFRLENVLD